VRTPCERVNKRWVERFRLVVHIGQCPFKAGVIECGNCPGLHVASKPTCCLVFCQKYCFAGFESCFNLFAIEYVYLKTLIIMDYRKLEYYYMLGKTAKTVGRVTLPLNNGLP
jgi:hypothetical protein